MRILIRTSKWAIWALRLGSLALPLAVVPVLMHRANAISTSTFETIALVGIAVAVLAVACSIAAFSRIWVTGDHGWGRAVTGLLCGLFCLSPVAYWSVGQLTYPSVDEVSTDTANPPALVSDVRLTPAPADMAARIATAFPNVKTRHYPLPASQMFDLVDKLVQARDWDVRRRREPSAEGDDGQINAIATTLFGFRDEVALRIATESGGSRVDMRSAALTSVYEPGVNGNRVEDFLTTLDTQVAVLMRDEPAGADDDNSDAADEAPPAPMPVPAARARKR